MRSFATIAITLALAAGTADAFEIAHTDGGDMVRWHAAPTFEASIKQGTGALRAAARQWNAVLPEGLAIDVVPAAGDARLDPRDYVNSVVWLDDEFGDEFDELALAATVRAYRKGSGMLVDADIAVNGAEYEWSMGEMSGCERAFDLQAVMTHELGHAIGLDHNTDDEDAVMFPAIPPCVAKRQLDDDDMAGVEVLYADAEAAGADEVAPPYGCSAAGGAGSAWLGLVLLALALCASRRRTAAVLAVAVCVFAAGSARAAVVRGVALEALSVRSAAVARGRVVDQETVVANGRIYRDTTVAVDACWRGDCPSTMVVRQLGGTVGDLVVDVEGTARFATGDEVVLFARHRRDGAWSPVGMALGSFVVRRAEQSVKAVRDTRGLVLAQPDGGVARGRVEEIDLDALERRVKAAK